MLRLMLLLPLVVVQVQWVLVLLLVEVVGRCQPDGGLGRGGGGRGPVVRPQREGQW